MEHIIQQEAARQIISTRVFATSREKLFEAWANPDHLKQWWGPKGFSNTFHEFNFRPEGSWIFTMHGPDGKDYYNKSKFIQIDHPDQIIFEHLEPMHWFRVTATFEPMGDKTKLTFAMLFDSVEECEKVKMYVVPSNEENFDRLEAVLLKV